MEKIKLQRGYTPRELDKMKIPKLNFTGEWHDAFGTPERTGIWLIYGNSGNGKTTFLTKLSKYLTMFDKVVYNSLEEGNSAAMQEAWRTENMKEVTGKIILVKEGMDVLCARLDRHKGPGIAIVDSAQYSHLSKSQFLDFAKQYEKKKLIIFTSHAEANAPKGTLAGAISYHAKLKVWVEGYRAFSKGRTIGPKGHIDIWDKGAANYWGNK